MLKVRKNMNLSNENKFRIADLPCRRQVSDCGFNTMLIYDLRSGSEFRTFKGYKTLNAPRTLKVYEIHNSQPEADEPLAQKFEIRNFLWHFYPNLLTKSQEQIN
jgi:hypothetical protein